MAFQLVKRLFTVDDYHKMGTVGILSEDDRVELIEGEIVEMTPIGSRHAGCVNRLNKLFSERMGRHAILSVQNPICLGERSEPQPDLALLRARADYYASAHPEPGDILLVVEVAETSTDYDREVKVALYSRAGIPETWLVDLESELVEVYRNPCSKGYSEIQRAVRGRGLAPQAFPDVEFAVDDILG